MKPGNEKIQDLKILYVEDEDTIREAVTELLSRRVSKLHTAPNGQEGLALFEKERPEIVISDIRMPIMNGLDMSRKIKEIDPNVKIIITSAHSDTSYFLEAIEIGISEYVLKPIARNKLFDSLYKSADTIYLRKKLERQFQTIAKLHGAIEQSQSFVIIFDLDKKIEYINPRFSEITGYALDEVLDENPQFTINNICDVPENNELKSVLEKPRQWRGEYCLKHKNGENIWLYGSFSPVLDKEGNLNSYVQVGEDISELKEMANALAASEDKLRNLVENLGEGIGILDLTYDFTFINEAMKDIFGINDLVGKNISFFSKIKEELEQFIDTARKLQNGDKADLELRIQTSALEEKHLSVTLTPQLDDRGNNIMGLFCIFKDISRMKELIEEIQAAREAAEKAYQTIEEQNLQLNDTNEKLQKSETKLSELNEILMEYIKATGK